MNIPIMSILMGILTIIMAAFGINMATSLGLSCIIVLLIFQPVPNMMIVPQFFSEMATSFTMVAIPLFVLVGNLMMRGSTGRNLIHFVSSLVCWHKGGLGSVNIVGSMIFGGISGSSLADTATFGTILIPEMEKEGYPRDLAGAITVTSSCLSTVIPPSILMVLGAVAISESVAKVLAAGVLPGIVITVCLLVPNYIIAIRHSYGVVGTFSFFEVVRRFLTCWTALMAPLVILGSIFTGIVTPTEGAAVAVLYLLIVDGLILRQLGWKEIYEALKATVYMTSGILFIATSSAIMSFIFSYDNLPQYLNQLLLGVGGGRVGFTVLLVLILILVGMVMDSTPAVLIFAPLFLPAAEAVGMDPVHYLIIIVVGLAVGLTTPPYGSCLFSVSAISQEPMERLIKAGIPFYAALLAALIIVAFIPQISLILPQMMGL